MFLTMRLGEVSGSGGADRFDPDEDSPSELNDGETGGPRAEAAQPPPPDIDLLAGEEVATSPPAPPATDLLASLGGILIGWLYSIVS